MHYQMFSGSARAGGGLKRQVPARDRAQPAMENYSANYGNVMQAGDVQTFIGCANEYFNNLHFRTSLEAKRRA